jgi:putative endonuclease
MAAEWYEQHGFVVLARNWRRPFGELDLVVGRSGLVVFCEVKTRTRSDFGGGAAAVTPAKQARIRRLAAEWLVTEHHPPVEVRFDVVAVDGGVVDIVPGAF